MCIWDDDGGTGSFFVFSLIDGEFRPFNKDKIIRTSVRLNENKFARGLENGTVEIYKFWFRN